MKFLAYQTVSFLLLFSPTSFARPSHAKPTVRLDYGSFEGMNDGDISLFLGMPFARPPIGNLRFAPPEPPMAFDGVRKAATFGAGCPQQRVGAAILPGISTSFPVPPLPVVSEDCLFVNVIKPKNISDGKKLPVLFWIFGGGFEAGDTSDNPGNSVVERSIALGEPVIYVSANYRLNAFGFLPGKEVQASGGSNAGIRDQRFAMEWIHKYIEIFGGDPSKVTIWGQSAGAASVATHFLLNDGDTGGLFRAGFMESGSPIIWPVKDVFAAQPIYDNLVNATGCFDEKDTLACLRSLPFEDILNAVDLTSNFLSFMSLELDWEPRVDGEFIKRPAVESLESGLYAKVPFITGDTDDEGTLFTLDQLNITTNREFLQFLERNYLQGASLLDLLDLGEAYPADPTKGSPFNTGILNTVTLQFKRLAAIQGDLIFQGPRRFFLGIASETQDAWSYLYKREKNTPIEGSFHGTDVAEIYGTPPGQFLGPGDQTQPDFIGTDALINFANNLNPMVPENPNSLLTTSGIDWKPWGSSKNWPPLLTFLDPAPAIAITPDVFREEQIQLLNKVSIAVAARTNDRLVINSVGQEILEL